MTSQIRICIRRLERLSIAYRTALSFVGPLQERDAKSITNDKYAQHIGTELRSLLNELYGLRDAVTAAAYRLKYREQNGFQMRSLWRIVSSDQGPLGRMIGQSMFDQDGDLLIDRMSLYRAVSMHCLGMTNPIFGDGYQKCIANGPFGEVTHIVFPLYDDIEHMREIEKGSSKGLLRRATKAEAERFLSKDAHIDALEFSFDCFVRLLQMAQLLATDVAIPSRPLMITDADIIEATVTDGLGQVTRVKRDATTGKLVEF